jgi:hypothetical protein
MLPLVPVTAGTDVPAAAPEATETVKVLLLLPAGMVAGEKLAVTPVGSPLTDNATAELNPFKLATVRAKEVELPTFTLAPMGFGISVKLWVETVTVNSSVRLNPPPVPITTMGNVPPAAFADAATVIVTGADALSVGDENETRTLGGAPAAASVTGELNPPCAIMDKLEVVEPPGVAARLEE